MNDTSTRRRTPAGAGTKVRILDAAVRIASREGVRALTFGRLSDATNLSKSGLFAHFGSHDALCADVVAEAERRFVAAVHPQDGAASMTALRDASVRFMRYCAGLLVDDAAFFATAVREGGALPADAHAGLRAFHARITGAFSAALRAAVARGDVRPFVDGEAFAFGTVAFGLSVACLAALEGDREAAFTRGVRHLDVILRDVATEQGARGLG